jgi:hypothetical protein
MPEICRFFGMIIAMYYKDHRPPHFHVIYGDYKVAINIETLQLIEGKLPKRALSMVLEWAHIHREELRKNWQLLEEAKPLLKIAELE